MSDKHLVLIQGCDQFIVTNLECVKCFEKQHMCQIKYTHPLTDHKAYKDSVKIISKCSCNKK